jgi:hypothetical protein
VSATAACLKEQQEVLIMGDKGGRKIKHKQSKQKASKQAKQVQQKKDRQPSTEERAGFSKTTGSARS